MTEFTFIWSITVGLLWKGKDTYLNTILPATTSNIYTLIHFSKSTGICTFFFDNVSTHDSHPLQHGTFSNLSNALGFRMSTIRISTCILLSLNSKLILDQSRGTKNCKMFLVSCHYHWKKTKQKTLRNTLFITCPFEKADKLFWQL